MLNMEKSGYQVQKILAKRAEAAHIALNLASYRKALSGAWSAEEATFYEMTVDALIERCRKLEQKLEQIEEDMIQEMEAVLVAGASGVPPGEEELWQK